MCLHVHVCVCVCVCVCVYCCCFLQDVGCGIGGPGREIASLSGAEVVGLNINKYQIRRAETLTKEKKLDHLCTYVEVSVLCMVLCVSVCCLVLCVSVCCMVLCVSVCCMVLCVSVCCMVLCVSVCCMVLFVNISSRGVLCDIRRACVRACRGVVPFVHVSVCV